MFKTANMHSLIFVLCALLATCTSQQINTTEAPVNSTDPNKDMYVIHAMVYQIGILTNKTDEDEANLTTVGHQEAVTFFKSNGTGIDLGNISSPLMTNVTAQSLVGVAPATADKSGQTQLPWSALENLANLPQHNIMDKQRKTRQAKAEGDPHLKSFVSLFKRSLNESKHFFDSTNSAPMKIEKGVAIVPNKAGVQSLSIPPLISFNNNFSDIPVPIPNTSVVHYAKVNTLVNMPQN